MVESQARLARVREKVMGWEDIDCLASVLMSDAESVELSGSFNQAALYMKDEKNQSLHCKRPLTGSPYVPTCVCVCV